MSHYAVVREAGPAWRDGGIPAQPDVADHAAFMNERADEGFVLFAGPLAGTENNVIVGARTCPATSASSLRFGRPGS
jgi:hypothetical protein